MSKEDNYEIIEKSKNKSEKILKTLLTKEIEKAKKEIDAKKGK